MKHIASILFVLFACIHCSYADKWDNRTGKLKGKKILVFTKNGKGFVHDNIPASIDMFFKIAKTEGFVVDTTTNSSVFVSASLSQYDAVIFSNTNNQVFENQKEKDGFVRFIRSGKGFMGIHSACGTEREWNWFKQMLGATFDFHPPFQQFFVNRIDSLHPSTSSLPSTWEVKDELYFMKEMNPEIRILMVSDFSLPDFHSSKPLPETFGNVFPCVWCNEFDGGRQWFTALGHDKSDYNNPLFINHIMGGLKWIVR